MTVIVTSNALALAAGLIKSREGCRLTAYQDEKGVWTIGWGHTGPEVHKGLVWTQAQADAQLMVDMKTAADAVARLAKGPLSDQQLAALISFTFNDGVAALESSTLLKEEISGDWLAVAHQFILWDHEGSKEDKGLLIRRMIEATTFLEGTP